MLGQNHKYTDDYSNIGLVDCHFVFRVNTSIEREYNTESRFYLFRDFFSQFRSKIFDLSNVPRNGRYFVLVIRIKIFIQLGQFRLILDGFQNFQLLSSREHCCGTTK